jgi:hypothetical protein
MSTGQLQVVQTITNIVLAVTGVVSLVALIVYVVKTWHIATQTARSAAATELAARATERSALTSEKVLEEMRAARYAETAPYVVAYFDIPYGDFLVHLVLKNIGRSAARDVTVQFTPPLGLVSKGGPPLPLPQFLRSAVPFLPPEYELRTILWSQYEVFADKSEIPQSFDAHVTYADARTGTVHSEAYMLDFTAFRDRAYTSPTTLDDVHKALKAIGDQQAKIAQSTAGLHKALTAGVYVANPSLLVESLPAAATPEERLHCKLLEVASLWRSWRARSEDARRGAVAELLPRLRLLRNQITRLASSVTDTPALEQTGKVGDALEALLAHRFYADGGQSHARFEQIGDAVFVRAPASGSDGSLTRPSADAVASPTSTPDTAEEENLEPG